MEPQSREIKKFEKKHIPRKITNLIPKSCIYVHITATDLKVAAKLALHARKDDAIRAT